MSRRLRKIRMILLTLALSTSLTTLTLSAFGESANADTQEIRDQMVVEYQARTGASAELAAAALDDQGTLADVLLAAGVTDGVNADVWIESNKDGQVFHVRTSDERIINGISKWSFKASTVVVEKAPVVDRFALDTDKMQEAIESVVPKHQGMAVSVDTGALIIYVVEDLKASDIDLLRKLTGFEKIEIELLAGEVTTSTNVYGGAALTSCTSGFTATQGTSSKGFYSAAHCGTYQNIFQSATSTSGTNFASATKSVQTYNANADIAYYLVPSSGNSFVGQFYGSGASLTAVKGTVAMAKGATACHRGKTVGWACGQVTNVSYKAPSNICPVATCNSNWVSVTASDRAGDSGGPWVFLNSSKYYAAGIHTGGDKASFSVYSKQIYFPSGTALVLG